MTTQHAYSINSSQQVIRGGTPLLAFVRATWGDGAPTAAELDACQAYVGRAVNSHAALVGALEGIAAHDEFTGGEPGSPIAQAYAILNALRLKALAALKLAKESP